MRNKILQILKENVFELLNKDIDENTKLISTGYLESFDVINLITLFEKEFNIDIKLEEIELSSFETVIAMEELIKYYVK
ncbi:acyl carrier protein [Enterococcus faecium]|uniref:acyl carrier protein n=1 Tax=Bacillota TaxID=1239 RepID=UPI0005E4D706|nr:MULTISPECIES: acyl carrier protein [Bacillota]MBJ0795880.1 acyl carrier protein [Enterococcus faecium]HES0992138.1 acyl carrier protein [Streptococcus pyogenes]MCC2716668.1 acyl carrier protein [Finegoldia magna]MCC9844655.1 acyl carrier protein [Streptococcus agalactiae]MDB8850158.1 acyl carrier protein [Peptostreptococcus anaerobius]